MNECVLQHLLPVHEKMEMHLNYRGIPEANVLYFSHPSKVSNINFLYASQKHLMFKENTEK